MNDANSTHPRPDARQPEPSIQSLDDLVSRRKWMFGALHPATLDARLRLGIRLLATGRDDDAVERLRELCDASQWIPGDTYSAAFGARLLLAAAHAVTGSPYDALSATEELIADLTAADGADDRIALASRHVAVMAYAAAGRLDDAIDMLGALASEQANSLGADHRDTLTTRCVLAASLRAAGRSEDAIEAFESVVADQRRVLGDDHHDTLIARMNLARCLAAFGRGQDAVALHVGLLADQARVLGADHPDTLETTNSVSDAYLAAGRLGEVGELLDTVRGQRNQEPDPTDAERVLSDEENYRILSESRSETEFYGTLLEEFQRRLGPDDPRTLYYRSAAAIAQVKEGHIEAALEEFGSLLPLEIAHHGASSSNVAESRMFLALCYLATGRSERVITWCESFLADYWNGLGWSHTAIECVRRILHAEYSAAGLSGDGNLRSAGRDDAEGLPIGAAPDADTALRVRGALRNLRTKSGQEPLDVWSIHEALESIYDVVGLADPAYSATDLDLSDEFWEFMPESNYRFRPLLPAVMAEAHLLSCIAALGPTHRDVATARRVLAVTYELTDTAHTRIDSDSAFSEMVDVSITALVDLKDWAEWNGLDEHRRAELAAADNSGHPWEVVDRLDTLLIDRLPVAGRALPDIGQRRSGLATAHPSPSRSGPLRELLESSHLDVLRDGARLADSMAGHCESEALAADVASPTDVGDAHPVSVPSDDVGGLDSDGGDIHVFEDRIAERERTLGPDHRDTLSARLGLATAYRDAGRTQDAIETAEALVVDMTRVRGRGHPDTHGVRDLIVRLYRESGYF